MTIEERLSANEKKIYYRYRWGRAADEKMASGIFTYAKPKSQTEKNHNKEALALLEIKRSQLIIEQQSVGTNYIELQNLYFDFTGKNLKFIPQRLI